MHSDMGIILQTGGTLIAAGATVWIAVKTSAAARAAEKAAEATRKATEANIYTRMMDEYRTEAMGVHAELLGRINSNFNREKIESAALSAYSTDEENSMFGTSSVVPETIKQIDAARRDFDQFFMKAADLCIQGYATDNLVRAVHDTFGHVLWRVAITLSLTRDKVKKIGYRTSHIQKFVHVCDIKLLD